MLAKVKSSPLVKRYILPVYRSLFPIYDVVYFIDKYLEDKGTSIIQVGSNDGKKSDPLNKLISENLSWKVTFVEPVPVYFERLKANYGENERFTFVNAAINNGENATFYAVRPEVREHLPDLPFWIEQLSSFDRSHIEKFFDGKLVPFIEELDLEGITLQSLIDNNSIEQVDLIHIDTEGYDWKILKQLSIERYKPRIILYEFVNLSPEELKESVDSLTPYYHIYLFKNDYLCLRKDLFDKADMRKIKRRKVE